ncbi:MAG: hypothetical protein AABY22_32405 [Nanoarchaeota archaeon]
MNKVKISLHGILGEKIGEKWNLSVKSVSEAIHAINILSHRKFYKELAENDKNNIKYQILVDNNKLEGIENLEINDTEAIRNSEFCIQRSNIKSIDIVPVLEGAGANSGIIATVVGALLIVVGVVLLFFPGTQALGVALIMAGLGLVAAGVMNLISKQPEFEDFRESRGKISYLFNGPTNISREGGPVPVGYGRLIVGSQVASATYEISNVSAEEDPSKLVYNR